MWRMLQLPLGRCPAVTAGWGSNAARFQFLGDGRQRRVTRSLNLGYHGRVVALALVAPRGLARRGRGGSSLGRT